MAHRTPLYGWHAANEGRIVDFAGWDMPVQYTSISEEHRTVREEAGIFDISHMGRLSFSGPDARDFIQSVYTNNAATLKDFQVRYGLICNENGGVRDDVLVYRWPYGWAMVVNASNRDKILSCLQQHKENRDIQIEDQTMQTCMVAVQGPKALTLCDELTEVDAKEMKYFFAAPTRYKEKQCIISRTGYTGEDGIEIMIGSEMAHTLWEDLISRGCKPCGLGARDTLRLEAAMPLYGHELNEDLSPLQAGLDWAVKLDKGEFIGRSAILERKNDPSARCRVGLELSGKRIAREGHQIVARGQSIGIVTSGTFSPTLQKSIAMGYVEPAFSDVGTTLAVDIRGREESAKVVGLPFYKKSN